MRNFIFLTAVLFLCACAETTQAPQNPKTTKTYNLVLKPAQFSDLPGWPGPGAKDLEAVATPLSLSCARILKKDSAEAFAAFPEAGTYNSWKNTCEKLSAVNQTDSAEMRRFLEENFRPYAISNGADPNGLFTGYYEASLKGSKVKTARYNVPLYSRPDDLVMVDLGQFREELKGQRIAGRVQAGNLKPYENRSAIVAGNWPHNDKVLVWVDSAIDAFFVQIQGSGIVEMEDGSVLRIGYAGQNGHPYYAIGKELVKRGALKQEDVSMHSIADWLNTHPDQADEIMNTNASYVFFKESKEGAKGGEGTVLTPGYSLAIDHSLLPYGAPIWIDAESPPSLGTPRLQRLLVTQDTGGAIRGPVRGDVFWGYGKNAENLAGPMKSAGKAWILLPKN